MSNSFKTLWIACQAPLSVGFPRQEYWNRLLFPSPGDLPNTGIEPMSLVLAGWFFTTEPNPYPHMCIYTYTLYNVNYIYIYVCVCVCVCVCVHVFFLTQWAVHMLGMSHQRVSVSKST